MKGRCFSVLLLFSFLAARVAFANGIVTSSPNPWMIYIGGFGGYSSVDFAYGANYFSTLSPPILGGNKVFHDNVFQQGASGGGQVGFQYHFRNPYFVGFSLSGMMNANKARLANTVESFISSSTSAFAINHEFRLNYTLDLTGVFGADITAHTHLYTKLGATYGRFTDKLFTTQAFAFPNPIPFLQAMETRGLWGVVLGLGVTQDLSRWVSAFAEYDHDSYGRRHLNAIANIAAPAPVPILTDHLTQNVRISADAVRVGLNVKFMHNVHQRYDWGIAHPWMMYIGGFGGYSSVDFAYGANYFSLTSNQVFNDSVFQQGASGGGQVGFQYHFRNPYFVGFSLSGMMNANKARLTNTVASFVVGPAPAAFTINHAFRLNYTLDLAGVLGADIAAHTHLYTKLGATYGRFTAKLFTTQAFAFPSPIPFLQATETRGLWGVVLGLGVTQDLSRWVSAFAEYDHDSYGRRHLNAFNNISPTITPAASDRLTQNIRISANAVRVGLNAKLMDDVATHPLRDWHIARPWMVYIGGFGGYSSVDFAYGTNYFSSITGNVETGGGGNQAFNNDVFQRGASGGGQVGFQYHFRNPYFVGFSFSGMMNANKARLANTVDVTLDLLAINHAFRLNYTLDLAGLFGADIAAHTHLYTKLGATYGRFRDRFFITPPRFPNPTPFFDETETRGLWGFVLGLGVTQDLSRWVSAFAEYDHDSYGRRDLNALDNISPTLPGVRSSHLTQNVAIMANVFRVGFNIKCNVG